MPTAPHATAAYTTVATRRSAQHAPSPQLQALTPKNVHAPLAC